MSTMVLMALGESRSVAIMKLPAALLTTMLGSWPNWDWSVSRVLAMSSGLRTSSSTGITYKKECCMGREGEDYLCPWALGPYLIGRLLKNIHSSKSVALLEIAAKIKMEVLKWAPDLWRVGQMLYS